MKKSIVIKLAIFLLVAVLVYSAFWFFKIGQTEKHISNFINENSQYISSGEIVVSGFPFSQKITINNLKFRIPNAVLANQQVIVESLEARSGIFSSGFSVSLMTGISLQDLEGNKSTVEFNKDPEISVTISDGMISKFSYQDFGYRAFDLDKNVVYGAGSSTVSLETSLTNDGSVITKISADIKDIENFDIIDAYKNALAKKVSDGIKTGEIIIEESSSALSNSQNSIDANKVDQQTEASTPSTAIVEKDSDTKIDPKPANVDAIAQSVAVTTLQDQNDPSQVKIDQTQKSPDAASDSSEVANALNVAVADNGLVKSNFMLSAEYSLVPLKLEESQTLDPSQINMPLKYSKVVRINNLEFSNPLFKISLNGEMSLFQDDSMPSGSISVTVENSKNLASYISVALAKMSEEKSKAAIDDSSLGNSPEVAGEDQVQTQNVATVDDASAAVENAAKDIITTSEELDPYHNFLKRVSENFIVVSEEIAAKNPVSKDEIEVFDIRREKNLEFLINETPLREILGKF